MELYDEDQENNPNEPIVLFLNESDRDGPTSTLKAAQKSYRKKKLDSSVDNWKTIVDILASRKVTAVIAKLTSYTFLHLSSSPYDHVVAELLSQISRVRHVFYVHESVMSGIQSEEGPFSEDSYFEPSPYFIPPTPKVRDKALEKLSSYGINLIVYTTNAQLSVMASQFLEECANHLILKIYIPIDGVFSQEARDLLALFQHYLNKVAGLQIRHNQHASGSGTMHEFYASGDISPETVTGEFNNFTKLLDAASNNPQVAIQMLENKGLRGTAVSDIVDRYSKEANRLKIDVRQEWERKKLLNRPGFIGGSQS